MTNPTHFDQPHHCPWCMATEPNAFLLQSNHWVKTPRGSGFDWCGTHGLCIAMDLTRNHVAYAAAMLTDPTRRDHCACYGRHAWRADCASNALRNYIDRARKVWPLPRQAWLNEYEALLDDPTAPTHTAVAVSEQLDLLEVS